MTAVAVPAAPARVGVAAGWWLTTAAGSAQTGHRLTLHASTGERSARTLCGRRLHKPRELRGVLHVGLCSDCRRKAARAVDPDRPAPESPAAAPPPPTRRVRARRSAPEVNTATARTARRVAFRAAFEPSDRAAQYVPQHYGHDDAARRAAALYPPPNGGGGVSAR